MKTETTDKAKMTERAPFGPGVHPGVAERTTVMEVWGSSIDDTGPDFCEFVLKNGTKVVARVRVSGD
jgi:hypothetical protein